MQSNMNTEAFNSINHKLSLFSETNTQPFIYRVHKELRDVNNKPYEPNMVSIGPYHHGKNHLKMMEEHKVRYLQQLVLDSRQQSAERYISAIGELEQKARDCYAESISLNGPQFVEMLILDGCFIIELVRKYNSKDSNDPIFQTQWVIGNLQRDLILFENQIPFFVLCKLFDLIEGQNKHQMLIEYLLRFCPTGFAFQTQLQRRRNRRSEEIKHVLDLVYNSWLDPTNIAGESSNSLGTKSNFIPSATRLKDANVKFRKEEGHSLFEVEFRNGIMKIPPLRFQDSTECCLRNLVLYEQYFLRGQRNLVANYMIFLDSLINSSSDVEILSEHEIIINWLGDNEAVANVINRLCNSIIYDRKHFVYAEMFDDVNNYYKKPWNRWKAMLRRDIFHSPWAYLSFFAALAILILSVVQAVCSILQVV